MTMMKVKFVSVTRRILDGRKILACILFAGIPALLFYGFSLFVLRALGFETMQILRDVAQQNEQSSFLGFLSNIGVWFWVSSAALCLSAGIAASSAERRWRELLFLVGMFSLLLAVDDFFMIHDRYANERLCALGYAVFAGFLLLRHLERIVEVDGFAYFFAGGLLAMSIATDVIQYGLPFSYELVQIFEEGCKFLGAAVWLYFCHRLSKFCSGSVGNGD